MAILSMTEQAREARVRRGLRRQGYTLIKSRARNWSINNHCKYMIVEAYNNSIVAGEKFDLNIEDVEKFLEREGS